MTPASLARTTYRSVFASAGYPALFVSASLSILGFSFQILVFSVTVFATTGSPAAASLAFAAGFLPQVLGGILLPSLADRIPPKALLIAGALMRSLVALILAVGGLGIVGSVCVIAAAALVSPLFSAAESGLVARILDGDRYVLGRSLFVITGMIVQLLGIALGGVALQFLTAQQAFLILSALHVAGALVCLAGVPRLGAAAAEPGRWRIGDTLRGYRALLSVPLIRALLLLWWVPLSLLVGAESLVVAYAGQAGAGAATTAVLIGAIPLGALIGEVLVGRLCPPAARERLVFPLLALLGVGLVAFAFGPPPLVAALVLSVASIGLAFSLGRQDVFRAALPADRVGVGFGLLGVGMMTGQGVGPIVAGPLASIVGVGPTIAICGALILVAGTLCFGPVQRIRWRAAERP
ncbi:MAG: hypothetical protein LBE60_10020 [Microbacterium sp.]|jgi:predicted MFS family arabinose efflux permease|uniref:MFS transporter n=1 Tax=Microbacterium sp. TaxID=51671 RepID=UPI00281B4428|nr:MFS transporter [Microbacterium sp.]MDR2321970.1 hypothetical protein [Microbacterium sp.]